MAPRSRSPQDRWNAARTVSALLQAGDGAAIEQIRSALPPGHDPAQLVALRTLLERVADVLHEPDPAAVAYLASVAELADESTAQPDTRAVIDPEPSTVEGSAYPSLTEWQETVPEGELPPALARAQNTAFGDAVTPASGVPPTVAADFSAVPHHAPDEIPVTRAANTEAEPAMFVASTAQRAPKVVDHRAARGRRPRTGTVQVIEDVMATLDPDAETQIPDG